MQMYNIILNPLSPFEIIDFLYFEASLIDNIHISLAKIGLYVILSLVFIMILTIFFENLNWLVSNKWSISKESMYVTIIKGLLIHGLKLFSGLVPSGCAFALLPFLVGLRYNYLDFSLQVLKFSTKFCISNSGVGNVLTARNYSMLPWGGDSTPQCSVDNFKLDPLWVAGLVDGEGSFHVSVSENKNSKLGFTVQPKFTLVLHNKDEPLLQKIKSSLGVGKICLQGSQKVQLQIQSLKELDSVINHFQKYPLITKKRADFNLIIMVNDIMRRKEHLTQEGLIKILAIKASMNRGLPDKLKLAAFFQDVVPVERPLVKLPQAIDPNWLAGFASGEGCFMIIIYKSKTRVGYGVQLIFQLTQHSRDQNLMQSFIIYFKCGYISIKKNRPNEVNYIVTKFDDILNKIIPFFKKHPILGMKALDFDDWCKVAELMQEKKHLTQAGLEQIRKIKAGMNTGRKC